MNFHQTLIWWAIAGISPIKARRNRAGVLWISKRTWKPGGHFA
jgi:hypothetical protein